MSNKSALSFASLCLADVENPPCANLHKCDYICKPILGQTPKPLKPTLTACLIIK